MENIELIRSAKRGDNRAFSKLIKLYEKDMYRVAKAIVKTDHDALDCMQDTILRAYKSIKNLKKEEYFKTWLIKILINCCNNFNSNREKLYNYFEYSNDATANINTDKIEIEGAMEKLEEELKIPVLLYYFEDMNISSIGECLNIPEGTVKSRLSRARAKLKELLDYKESRVI